MSENELNNKIIISFVFPQGTLKKTDQHRLNEIATNGREYGKSTNPYIRFPKGTLKTRRYLRSSVICNKSVIISVYLRGINAYSKRHHDKGSYYY